MLFERGSRTWTSRSRSGHDVPDVATIAVGDIHGHLAALNDLLSQLRGEVGAGDTVVFLGDYIDRGPDSKGCIDQILKFRDEISARVVTLMGNHEEWLLKALDDPHHFTWLTVMGGFATVSSYSIRASAVLLQALKEAGPALLLESVALPYGRFLEAIPSNHITFFRELSLFHRSDGAVCVHGGLDPDAGPLETQAPKSLIWGTSKFPGAYAGPDTVIYGHRDNADLDLAGWPHPTSNTTLSELTPSHTAC